MRHVTASPFHEIYLVIRNDNALQGFDLATQFVSKPSGIYRVIAVYKLVFYLGTRVIIDDRTAHRKLIKVIICEVIDDLFHCRLKAFMIPIETLSSAKSLK